MSDALDSCCWQVSPDGSWDYAAYAWAAGRGPARQLALESRPEGELIYQKVRAIRREDLDGLAPCGTFIECPEQIPASAPGVGEYFKRWPYRLWNEEFPCRKDALKNTRHIAG